MRHKERKTVYYIYKGHKKIGEPYDTYDEAYGFLSFIMMIKPFEFGYDIKACEITKKS